MRNPTRQLLLVLAPLSAAAYGIFSLASCGRGGPADNVVLVVIDTLRQDHLATYGYSRDPAPFLSELAREGAVFDGLSPSSWTKPAVTSLLTGLHPVRHQTVDRHDALPAAAPLLAEAFLSHGYQTLGASANGWISPVFGFDRGFERFLDYKDFRGIDLNRNLSMWLDRLKPPFFLFVLYIDPHAPYDPKVAWDGQPLPAALRTAGALKAADLGSARAHPRSEHFLARARDLYDGDIRGADDALRDLVKGLERRGLMDSTVLIVTSDHGEEFGEHGGMSHGQTLYQEVLRVPLVIHAPHRFRGGRRFGRASLLDVAPTLYELLGWKSAKAAPRPDGSSHARLLAGEDDEPSAKPRALLAHLDFTDGTALALLEGDQKFILEKNKEELFDLERDPREQRNLFGHPKTMAASSRLASAMVGLYNSYSRSSLASGTAEIDDALKHSLMALGYISSGRKIRKRAIPRRMTLPPADWESWEPFGTLSNCVQPAAPDADRYLLEGWYDAERGGRWSKRRGTLALNASTAEPQARLALLGINHRPAPVRLQVKVAHVPVLETEVGNGHFRLTVEVPGVPLKSSRTLVEIETDSAFVPSRDGGTDPRSLGLFFTSICFEPASAAVPLPATGRTG